MSPRRVGRGWLARGLIAVPALLALVAVALLLTLGTPWGRAHLLATLLERVNRALPGRVEVSALERLSPWGVALSGVRLRDPLGHEVLALDSVRAELAPLELVHGKIVLRSLVIGPGQIDLTDLREEDRGILAAVRAARAPEAESASRSPPPYVRIERLTLTDLGVRAPVLAAPWQALRVVGLQASASLVLDGTPEVELTSLSCDVLRGERLLARLPRVTAHLAHAGEASELMLELELGAARVRARAHGVLPPALQQTDPVTAEVQLDGVSAEELGQLLDDATLSSAFEGPAALQLEVSGSLARLVAHGLLETRAGEIELDAQLRERRSAELTLKAPRLTLRALRAELPEAPLTLVVEASTELSELPLLPLRLHVHSASWGGEPLPELSAAGRWSDAGLGALELTASRGESRIDALGHYETDGGAALRLNADVREPELRSLAAAAGRREEPGGGLRAELTLQRSAAGALQVRGNVRAKALRAPGFSLDTGRVDVDVRGPLLALGGRAQLDVTGLTLGAASVRRASLSVDGDPREYRLQGSAAFEGLSANLDLLARHEAERWRVRGRANGRFADAPWSVGIAPTSIELSGRVETGGLVISAGKQRLNVSGSLARERSDLSLSASDLDVGQLAALAGLGSTWTGRAQLVAHLQGSLDQPQLTSSLTASRLGRLGVASVDASLGVALDAERGRAGLDVALSGSNTPRWVDASLAVSSEFRGGAGWTERLLDARQRAQLELRSLQLDALGAWLGRELPADGTLAGRATIVGSLQAPVVHATLHGALQEVLGVRGLSVDQSLDYEGGQLDAKLDVADPVGPWVHADSRVQLDPGDARDVTQLAARARGLADTSHWELRLALQPRTLGVIAPLASSALASIALEGHAAVAHEPGAEPGGDADFALTETRALADTRCHDAGVKVAIAATLAQGHLEARLAATHRGTELARVSTRAALQLAPALRGGVLDLGEVSAELASRGLRLEQIPYLCQRVRGQMDANVALTDPLGNAPKLDARVDATGLSLGAEPALDLQLRAHADGAAAQADLAVSAPGGRSTLSARLPISWSAGRFRVASDAPIVASAHLDTLPIAPLLDPEGAISDASGSISGQLAVQGTLSAPEPSGQLELRDAELTATALAQPLHGVSGRFRFDRQQLEIAGFEARDRDGWLRLSGKVERSGVEALAVRLNVSARSFPLRQRGQVVATTSGHAKIDATLSRSHSRVAVQLVDADTWLEKVQARAGIDLRAHPDYATLGAPVAAAPNAVGPAASEATPTGPGDAPVSTSEVTLDASDHFWIKREDFAVQLSTRLQALIVADQINVKGRVEMYRGYLDLMGTVFELDRGSYLEFTGAAALDPSVSISARHENRSSGKTVKVAIGGRGSKPELKFYIDDAEVSAGEALEELVGRRGSGNANATQDAKSFVSGLTAGLLATSARRELGAAAPIIMIEPGDQTGEGRIRAGFELDTLVPSALRQLITGVYVEGIVEREGSANAQGQSQQASTQAGVLLELYFPHQLFTTGQWGPGTTWSIDWGWQL